MGRGVTLGLPFRAKVSSMRLQDLCMKPDFVIARRNAPRQSGLTAGSQDCRVGYASLQ